MKEQIKELRNKTDVSVMVCKRALEESGGDMDKALLILKKEGVKVAEKKSERELKSGLIESYIHAGGSVGVLLDVRCETDFVARNEKFKEFAHDIAMHIAALEPALLKKEDISQEEETEIRRLFQEEAAKIDKPDDIKKQIVDGKLKSYFKERVLLSQPFVKNSDITVEGYVREMIQKFGENIEIAKFVRFSI